LEDGASWTDPWANRKAIQRPLMNAGREGFLIGAPKVAALDRRKTLPVAVLRTRKAQGGSPVDFRSMAVIAAWDVEGRRLHARLAFPRPAPAPAKPISSSAGKGDSFSGDETAMIGEASTIELFSRLNLPIAAGEYVISLVCLNETANRCRTQVVDSAAFHDEAAAAYLRALRAEEMGPLRIRPEPGQGQAGYAKQDKSPEIPEEPGIALSAQRVTALRADRPCMLHGSFRLKADALPPGPAATSGATPANAAGAPTALVPIGLLLTGSVDASPVVVNLEAPSYAPLIRDGGENYATGYFSLDLRAHADLPGTPQTFFLYAFSGECSAGPALAAFVNPVLTWKTQAEFRRETAAAAHRAP
jgi:hypothetical protein